MAFSRYSGRKSCLSLWNVKTPSQIFDILRARPMSTHSEGNIPSLGLPPRLPALPPAPCQAPAPVSDDSDHVIVDADVPETMVVNTQQNVSRTKFDFSGLTELPPSGSPDFLPAVQLRIDICKYICDFSSSTQNQQLARRTKTIALKDLVWLMNRKKDVLSFPPELQHSMFSMFEDNIFGQTPFIDVKTESLVGALVVDPAWEHLEHVYRILMGFIRFFPNAEELNVRTAKRAVILMNLPDPNERTGLASFLKAYLTLRPGDTNELIEAMRHALVNVQERAYTAFAVVPILSVLQGIDWSTISPEITYDLVVRTILPLVTHPHLKTFHSAMKSLFSMMLKDRYDLQKIVIERMIAQWPRTCADKQPPYLAVLLQTLKVTGPQVFNQIGPKIFAFLGSLVESQHYKVALVALQLWTAPEAPFIHENKKLAWKYFLSPVTLVAKEHWNKSVKTLAANVLTALKRCSAQKPMSLSRTARNALLTSSFSEGQPDENTALQGWAMIARWASKRDSSIDLTAVLNEAHQEFSDRRNLIIRVANALSAS